MKNLFKALCFLMVFVLLFVWLDNMFYSYDTSWEATDDWGQQFDIVFMGNSHVYSDINPVIVNDALGLNTIALSSSLQPADLTYYNLKSLLKKTKPKALIISATVANYSVKSVYDRGAQGLLYWSLDGIRNSITRARIVLALFPSDSWLEAFSSLFRPMETWTRFSHWNKEYTPNTILGYQKSDGLMSEDTNLKDLEGSYQNAYSNVELHEGNINLTYIIKLLDIAQKKDIPVYFIKSPVALYSDTYVNTIFALKELQKKYSVLKEVHDYNLDLTEIGLTNQDFRETGHLNNLGAAKFTEYLAKDIGRWFGIAPDFSKVGWFRGEHFEPLPDGQFRYTVDLYDSCLIRFTAKNENKETIVSTDYSKDNSIDFPALGSNCTLFYEVKADHPGSYTYDHPQSLKYILTPSTLKSYNSGHVNVTQDGNTLTLVNSFDDVPVQYAWYVYKDSNPILKQMYTLDNSNSFSYEFTDPGNYSITAFVRTMDKSDTKSIRAVNIEVGKAGLTWNKP